MTNRRQFGTCSYEELTRCVEARIEWIREDKAFRSDPNSMKYPHVRISRLFSIIRNEWEIRRLLKMRRQLKKSKDRGWDPDKHDAFIDKSMMELSKMTDEQLIGELIEAVKDQQDERLASPYHLGNVRDVLHNRLQSFRDIAGAMQQANQQLRRQLLAKEREEDAQRNAEGRR